MSVWQKIPILGWVYEAQNDVPYKERLKTKLRRHVRSAAAATAILQPILAIVGTAAIEIVNDSWEELDAAIDRLDDGTAQNIYGYYMLISLA
jgi:hypothetical protein